MSRRCDLCGKTPIVTATRSHSLQKTKKKSFPNVQPITIDGKKMKICNRCRRTIVKNDGKIIAKSHKR